MADDSLLTFFDLANAPQEEAAMRARARAAALSKERGLAFLAQGSTDPEIRRMGEQGYNRAEKEREAVSQGMPESVLKLALERTGQERQLAALNLQGEQIRGQLGIAQSQLQLQAMEPFIRSMLEAQTEEDKIKAVAAHFGPLGAKLGELISGPAQAKKKAAQKVLQQTESVVGGKGPKAAAPTAAPPAASKPSQTATNIDALRQKYLGIAKTE